MTAISKALQPMGDRAKTVMAAPRPGPCIAELREAFAISDRVLVMKSGAIIGEGPPQAFADHAKLRGLF
jgi:ABC-type uncharacterized transport system ATPase subunit